MNPSRIVLSSILCAGPGLSSPAAAQVTPQVAQPPAQAVQPPAIQERIARLEKELARLQEELRYIGELKDRGGLNGEVIRQIRSRVPKPDSVDVGVGNWIMLMAKRAKLLNEEEKSRLLPDVAMTVNDIPVRQQRLDEMMEYLKSYRPAATEEELMGQTILAIAGGEWPKHLYSRFRADASKRMLEIQSAALKGADFTDLAKNQSDDRASAANGGDLGLIGRDCEYGLNFAKAAFTTPIGGISGIVSTPNGLHLVKPTAYEKGDSPEQDRVRVSHILVLHAPAPDEIAQSIDGVPNGRAVIKVRDPELLRLMPKPYR